MPTTEWELKPEKAETKDSATKLKATHVKEKSIEEEYDSSLDD